jgi:sensor histidine kinase YesM
MIAVTDKETFYAADIYKPWKKFPWFDSIRNGQPVTLLNRADSSSFLMKIGDQLLLVDFQQKKVLLNIYMPESVDACRINDDEVLAGVSFKWKFYRINIAKQKITKTYTTAIDQHNRPVSAETMLMEKAADGNIYITTRFSGLIRFDPVSETFFSYTHDFFSVSSISTDKLRYVVANPDGYLVITSRAGINITNVFQSAFSSTEYFKYPDGTIIDEGIIGAIQDRKKNLWMTTLTQVFMWQEAGEFVKPVIHLHDLKSPDGAVVSNGLSSLDKYGRIWLPFTGYGIVIYNDDGKIVKELKNNIKTAGYIPDINVRVIRQNNNGKMLVGTSEGIFIIDPGSFAVDSITFKPLLDSMEQKRVVDILPVGNSIWVTTSPNGAVYKYDLSSGQIKVFTKKQGIGSLRNYMLVKDKAGDIYVTSYNGLSIIKPGGTIKVIDKNSGLKDLRVETALVDDRGYVWLANTGTLIRYNPVKETFDYYDQRNGINKTGFQIGSACKTWNGKLIFGLNRGIVMVDPLLANSWQQKVNFTIRRVNTDNTYDPVNGAEPLRLPYNNAKISFSYLNSDLIAGNQFFYRYKMEGLDTGWSNPTGNHPVAYNLRPGIYTFYMQASYNEANWIDFPHPVSIVVEAPFWQRWWFYVLIAVFTIGTTIVVVRAAQSSKEQKRKLEELNRLMNESRLMAIRSQMNPHFIFNSLNAIQETIVMQDFDTAYQYLSKFSKLLRQVLNNSEVNFIPLKDEIEVNQLYLELESLRFKRSFSYNLHVEDNIDTDSTKFPSLLLQPFIENAIWHGLMHKQGEKKLDISFALQNDHLECIIEDNGIGRKRSAEIKKNKLGSQYFESKGTKLSGQRIELLNETGHTRATIQIEDLLNKDGVAAGTKVILKIPLDYET